jgi:hypothetical protein
MVLTLNSPLTNSLVDNLTRIAPPQSGNQQQQQQQESHGSSGQGVKNKNQGKNKKKLVAVQKEQPLVPGADNSAKVRNYVHSPLVDVGRRHVLMLATKSFLR